MGNRWIPAAGCFFNGSLADGEGERAAACLGPMERTEQKYALVFADASAFVRIYNRICQDGS